MHSLALTAFLQCFTLRIILGVNTSLIETRWKTSQDRFSIISGVSCSDNELAALQERSAESNFLHHRKAAGSVGRLVSTLDLHRVALDNPIFTKSVKVNSFVVEGQDVGVTPNEARA